MSEHSAERNLPEQCRAQLERSNEYVSWSGRLIACATQDCEFAASTESALCPICLDEIRRNA